MRVKEIRDESDRACGSCADSGTVAYATCGTAADAACETR